MEQIGNILPTALLCVSVLISVLSFVLAVRKRLKSSPTKQVNGNDEQNKPSAIETALDVLETVRGYMVSAEGLYNSMVVGKSGQMKLQDVIKNLKVDALTNGEQFDEDGYTEFINEIVDITHQINNKV